MMSENTARFAFPMIQPGQAQKEVFHNEALALLDMVVHAAVEGIGGDVPPAAPVIGQCWIVGSSPSGEWVGEANSLACWTSGGWRFIAPIDGMRVWCRDLEYYCAWTGSTWIEGVIQGATVEIDGKTVLGPQQSAIDNVSGGGNVDVEARAVVALILAVMRNHGLIAT